MKKTLEEKLQMCKKHSDEGKSLSYVSEIHGIYDANDYFTFLKIYNYAKFY